MLVILSDNGYFLQLQFSYRGLLINKGLILHGGNEGVASMPPGLCLGALLNAQYTVEIYNFLIGWVPFTKEKMPGCHFKNEAYRQEKMPWCPCSFKNKAYRPVNCYTVTFKMIVKGANIY